MPTSLVRLAVLILPCPVVAAVVVACSDAPQAPIGGTQLFDGSPDPNITAPVPDGGDAGCMAPDAAGSTWTALYADIFGPQGQGNCGAVSRGGTATCHHDATLNGAMASSFICGDTQESCYEGITDAGANYFGTQLVIPNQPCTSGLLVVLRHDGGGEMPFDPNTVVFSDQQMGRVAAWVAQGAQNN